MTQPTDDLKESLDAWPDLTPDPQAMERTSQRMISRFTALRATAAEDLIEPQFRLLTIVWAAIAIIVYLAWPYFSRFFIDYPSCGTLLACLAGLSLLAPLLLLPLLRGERAETISFQSNGGNTKC
jgi:hypothetical protein